MGLFDGFSAKIKPKEVAKDRLRLILIRALLEVLLIFGRKKLIFSYILSYYIYFIEKKAIIIYNYVCNL